MALESVFAIAPPLVGQQNKDTKNGDMKSSQNEAFKEDFEDDENGDLEEGEILDSGGEEDDSKAGLSLNQEASGLLKRSLIGVGSPSELKKTDHANNIKEILVLAGNVDALQAVIAGPQSAKRKNLDLDPEGKNGFDESQKLGSKKKVPRYVDHDFAMDEEGWSPPSISFKGAKVKDTRFDYSRELAAYRGSPYSSSDSNPPYDEPHNSDSPNHRSKSPNMEENGETKIRKSKTLKNTSKSRKSSGKVGKKRKLLESKGIRRKKEHKIKTVCKFFMEGKCSKGIDCPFLHTGSPEKKKELCKFYLNGFCAKGNVCLFMHDDFPCKFFHTGAKCYANDKCRFSHKPLSNETKKLLDRYLQSSHVDEESDYHERSRRDHKEPKGKRPCLLGSPPRHIKEAAETKRWQEEMIKLQQKGKGRSAFEIQVSPPRNQVSQIREIKSPIKFSKPNFYTDTLQGSPSSKKCPVVNRSPECRMSTLTPNSSSECPQQVFSKGNCDNHDWKNICELVDKLSPPKNEETSPVVSCNEQEISKQNIKQEIAEMVEDRETPMEFDEILSPRTTNEGVTLNTEVNDGFSDSDKRSPVKDKDVPLTATSPPPVSLAEPAPPPINIPSHLPRKQRELYLRIQQHQKEVASRDLKNNNNEASENGDKTATDSEKVINETEPTDTREKWYSSEEDDDIDDTDQPLANVLKKLHTMPPTKLGTSSNSSVDVWQMIMSNANRQKDNQKTQSIVASEPEEFWQNILSSAASPSTVKASFSTSNTNQSFLPLGNILAAEIQSSSNLVSVGDPNISSSEQKPSYPRDPRLLNRDLRKVSSVSKELSALSPNVPEEKTSPLFLSIESGTGSISNKLKDINSMLQNQTPAVVVEGLAGMGNIPYKLHEIVASSPNYLSYIAASQSDPKLLSDPRLRKHIAQGSINQQAQPLYQQCKSNALPNLPPHNIHIGLSHSIPEKAASVCTEDQSIPEPKQILDRVVDPRIRRTDSLGDPRRVNANNSNHTPSENVWTPPAPSIPSPAPSIPSPASHLPRAYADPRLAKLHQLQRQLDPRRVKPVSERFGTEQRPSVIQEKQKLNTLNLPTRKLNNISTVAKNIRSQADSQNQSSQSSDLVPLANSLGQKGKDSENVTKIVDKSLSRKSSMTYTSPLNSYEDSLVDSKSSYNSYNRRPNKRLPNSTPCLEPSILSLSSMPSKEIIESIKSSPDFTMCIPSVTESQCVDSNASLKDMFKTIDPTASPFC